MRAYIDESFRGDDGNGCYLFAAVILAAQHEEDARDALRKALPGRLSRLHWRVDQRGLRAKGIKVLSSLPLQGLVLYRLEVERKSAERARQHAMWNLIAELGRRDVHDAVFEAREPGQNKKDQKTLHAISRAGVAGPGFRYTFTRPHDEPLLWLPDYLAGAAGEYLHTGSGRYLGMLPAALLERVEMPPLR